MKSIFITGSNSGIGKETAKYFASKGWQVIATMRNLEKAGELSDIPNITIMPLDVTNSEQIKDTCQKALEKYDIDVVLSNAGYGIMGPLEELPEKEIRGVFDTNVFGTLLVLQQFIPHFKNRKSGVILVTTSLASFISLPRDSIYGATKHALQGIVESLYYDLKPYGVQVKSMIPGGTQTNFQMPIRIFKGYEQTMMKQVQFLLDGSKSFPEATEAAEVMYKAATDGEDRINYPTDSICERLYNKYQDMDKEEFKNYFYDQLYN